MQKTPYVFPIVGGRKVEHLNDNLEALSIVLTPEHITYLESIVPFDKGFPTNLLVSPHRFLAVLVFSLLVKEDLNGSCTMLETPDDSDAWLDRAMARITTSDTRRPGISRSGPRKRRSVLLPPRTSCRFKG